MSNELVSTAWAAQALGVSIATVPRLVRRGELVAATKAPGKRGAYLFHQAEVIRAASQRKAAA